eukprot:TRINITY_DN11421_c0_g3_i2.p1 TRINITY_DN11421_c0_g3~~TRINITY_DN11421_c0_g3_i2.p1  ORF type:complete len:143 (+),score=44.06 TRINITY_DN11421_c0_g3_i2:482-910(+)
MTSDTKNITRNNLKSEDDGTAEYSFGAPDIRSILNYNSTPRIRVDKEKRLQELDLPKGYQKELHGLRMLNAELRKELAEKSRAKVKAEKLHTERVRYKKQMRRTLESKEKFYGKQKNELLKRQEESDGLKASVKGSLIQCTE